MYWSSRGLIILVSMLICGLLSQTSFFTRQSEQSLRVLFTLRGERPTSQDIVIVGIDEESLDKLGPWPFPRQNHVKLFNAIKKAKAVGFDLIFAEKSENFELLAQQGVPVVMAVASSYEGKLLAPGVSANPWIQLGHIETELGTDGIVRKVRLLKDGFPCLAYAMRGQEISPIKQAGRQRLINFYGPEFTFLYISYWDVLEGKFSADFFANRYVLVGAKAVGLGDSHITPFSRVYPVPGVEIQATILNNLLDSSFLRYSPLSLQYFISFVLLVIFVFIFSRNSAGKNLLFCCVNLVILYCFSWFLFINNLFFDPFLPVFLVFLGFLLHMSVVWGRVTRDVLREINSLNKQLEEGVQIFFKTVPYPFDIFDGIVDTEKRERLGGLDRYIHRLRQGIRTLSLQNSFVKHLVSAEAPPFIFWSSDTGQVVVANARFLSLWRSLKISEEPPDLPDFLRLLDEKGTTEKKVKEKAAEVFSSFNEDCWQGKERICDIFLRAAGQRIWLRVVCHEVDDKRLGFKGILASFTDVTEIRELERMKGEVMNIVSHELKLPLTTIIGYSEILADSVAGSEREYASKVLSQARRLANMIEDFLNIARVENKRKSDNIFPFDLLNVVNDALAVAKVAADSKKIGFVSELPVKISPVVGDETLMTQAVINLFDNAIKFSPEETLITVCVVESETEFLITVADQGVGVGDHEKETIFEKFSRGSKKKKETGFGLGLSFVFQVVESHNGKIWVTDAKGGGAVFHISLPKKDNGH